MNGTGASAGIGIGKAVILTQECPQAVRESITDAEAEIRRFRKAVETGAAEAASLAKSAAGRIGSKRAEIFTGHLALMQDPVLSSEIESLIKRELVCSPYAVELVLRDYEERFSSMENELMRERAADIQDVRLLLQRILLGVKGADILALPAGSILIARDLTPSVAAGMDPLFVSGIVTELGGRTSHTAILARALDIPAVVVPGILSQVNDGDFVIIDGDTGEILISPDIAMMDWYEERKQEQRREKEQLRQYIGCPSVTADGVPVAIEANIGRLRDLEQVLDYGGSGIGLFRTEYLFMDRDRLPSEEEQFQVYKAAAVSMRGQPVTIRTLDVGGDKAVSYLGLEKDENPFLGYRGIRFCLDRKEDIYKPQLRALLRAGVYGDIRIMLPMITCLEELRETKALIEDAKQELEREGTAFCRDIAIGIMVETAAASLMADVLAEESDFFSIGTNDLTQYTMAVDRGNERVSYLYSTFHPAVLRSIRHIIDCGHKAGIKVGMCGEAAGDPLMIPLLLAFGLDEFSVNPLTMLKAKRLIAGYCMEEVQPAASQAMKLVTAGEVEAYMKEFDSSRRQ